jgi:hypothetical protein
MLNTDLCKLGLGTILFFACQSLWAQGTQKFANGETCTIMGKIPGVTYSEKDKKVEVTLCQDSLGGQDSVLAICPKVIKTNPAIEVFDLKGLLNKQDFERGQCENLPNQSVQVKKIGKFKSSVSCSYTPSILAYYHVSRFLGNILFVPPATIRTVPLILVKKQAEVALAATKTGEIIDSTWRSYKKRVSAPDSDTKSRFLFTPDRKQVYGALVHNPTGEEDFTTYMNDAEGIQMDRARVFMKTDAFLMLSDERDVKSFISENPTPEEVKKFFLLEDFSDMIVLDTLMTQEDRYNNISSKEVLFHVDKKSDGAVSIHPLDKNEFDSSDNSQVMVRRVLLKDNDCGVAAEAGVLRKNINLESGITKKLAHIRPSTYFRIQKLATELQQESMKNFFIKETLMTVADFNQFKQTTANLARELYQKCKNKTLHLDLDREVHFGKKSTTLNCESP